MRSTLEAIHKCAGLQLQVVVTGMHLSEKFGLTVREIEAAGLNIVARIPLALGAASGGEMARNLAKTLDGCVDAFEQVGPDIVLLLGDRGEMLAGALAAIHLNIPVVHIHGGERSGTVDEPVRHAISKLSHFHFAATAEARERLIRMGERPDHILVTGAPGLDGLREMAVESRSELCLRFDLDPDQKIALFVYHPVIQEVAKARHEAETALRHLLERNVQVLALMPNSDAGSSQIRALLESYEQHPRVRVVTHLPRATFVSWMAVCDLMIGNSSSGIIEAASFGIPVINVGVRQNLRERNGNVIDVSSPLDQPEALAGAVTRALDGPRFDERNVYGDGNAGSSIVERLLTLPLTPENLHKANTY